MQGFLDETRQAFLTIELRQGPLDFLIDTGFNGSLIVGEELFSAADALHAEGKVVTELAAGQTADFQSFIIDLIWFDEQTLAQILVGPGKECLVGTRLLDEHCLQIDYRKRTVDLD